MEKVARLDHHAKQQLGDRAVTAADRPSRAAAEDAVRTLIRWSGDDPDREGLLGTPGRVVRAYEEWFAGYFEDPREYLKRTFEEVGGYDEIVLLRDIEFESHCEHHMAPIIGRVHILAIFPAIALLESRSSLALSTSMQSVFKFRKK